MARVIVEALDSVHGRTAAGLDARLESLVDNEWVPVVERRTDASGRIEEWGGTDGGRGLYRLVFDVDRYFSGLGLCTVHPEVAATFRVADGESGHRVSLTLSLNHYAVAFIAD
ncbi:MULTISPECIES: hydroxyisourate hydrolase [unclassified Kitasatospora]|uniref:hydroxyisourate hydrolase n=1 Tax=unclassified Kitasatospora TaxID=2633591 RepID=UPI002475628C|nr:hydroxyisourate hydrolase [Kitasatospora sp. MAA19]MDH6709580.1 5-hydroxyisourate hydrolase [Kitasatospora sp. MAA19]